MRQLRRKNNFFKYWIDLTRFKRVRFSFSERFNCFFKQELGIIVLGNASALTNFKKIGGHLALPSSANKSDLFVLKSKWVGYPKKVVSTPTFPPQKDSGSFEVNLFEENE